MTASEPAPSSASGLPRDATIYGLASLITQGALILAVPVYARVLGPSGFGLIELLVVGLNLVALVVMGGFDLAAIRLYFGAKDPNKQRRVLSTGLLAVASVSLLGTIAVFLAEDAIERTYLQAPVGDESIVVVALALPLFVAARYARESFRAQRRPWAYLVNSSTAGLLQVGIGVALIAWFDFGPAGVMLGYLIAAAVTLVMSLFGSRGLFGFEFSKADLRGLLRFGIPLVWTGLAGWSLMFVDRLVLSAFVGVDDVGIYALASRMGMALTLMIYAFTRAWTPAMLELAESDRGAERRTRVRVVSLYLAGAAWVGVALSVLADPLVRFIAGSAFEDAADLVPIIVVGLVFFAIVPIIQMPMLIEQRTGVLARASIGAAAVNLVANLALVPFYGLAAAAWSTLLALAFQTGLYWRAGARLDATRYPATAIARILVLAAAFCALGWLGFPDGSTGLLLRVVVVGAFPAALVGTGAVPLNEVMNALRKVAGALRRSADR